MRTFKGIVSECVINDLFDVSKIKTEANKMQKEKKELIKKFKVVIEDLMDNYEEYTDEEKALLMWKLTGENIQKLMANILA